MWPFGPLVNFSFSLPVFFDFSGIFLPIFLIFGQYIDNYWQKSCIYVFFFWGGGGENVKVTKTQNLKHMCSAISLSFYIRSVCNLAGVYYRQ